MVDSQPMINKIDCSSLSNLDEITTKEFILKLHINFDTKTIFGSNFLIMESINDDTSVISLDTKALKITSVSQISNFKSFLLENNSQDTPDFFFQDFSAMAQNLEFHLDDPIANCEFLGQRLIIKLDRKLKKNEQICIQVQFETTNTGNSGSSALNWLTPEQTAEKQQPYLFTQCQEIYARTLFPCQDSPAVKSKYSAHAQIKDNLTIYMSGNLVGTKKVNQEMQICSFVQKIPVPSYLVAIVAGKLGIKQIGPRTGVISEPKFLTAYAEELSELESYVVEIEKYLTPYVWNTYNIVILPPSFPMGGMENPQLTFASPTIIAGDKSLVDVVIHEITHSWSGNLVSCKNWSCFWLNEGMTMFIERQITKILHGRDAFKMDAFIKYQSLKEYIDETGIDHNFTRLTPQLDGLDPEDAFSLIPYEKGFLFMHYLQKRTGGEQIFQKFLQKFFTELAYKSIDNQDFQNFYLSFLIQELGSDKANKINSSIDWDTWLNKPGHPIELIDFENEKYKQAKSLSELVIGQETINSAVKEAYDKFSVLQKQVFLEFLLEKFNQVSNVKSEQLGEIINCKDSGNVEILYRWLALSLKTKNYKVLGLVEKFLGEVGRMKFVRPLYQLLNDYDSSLTQQIFKQNFTFYHPICQEVITKLLNKK